MSHICVIGNAPSHAGLWVVVSRKGRQIISRVEDPDGNEIARRVFTLANFITWRWNLECKYPNGTDRAQAACTSIIYGENNNATRN